MARKSGLKPGALNDGGYAWALEVCEDKWLLAAFETVKARVLNVKWKADFVEHFYERGNPVTFYTLKQVNKELTRLRCGIEPLEIIETDVSDYVRDIDKPNRARIRCDLRDQYLSMDNGQKETWVRNALTDIKALQPPHQTYDEWKKAKSAPPTPL